MPKKKLGEIAEPAPVEQPSEIPVTPVEQPSEIPAAPVELGSLIVNANPQGVKIDFLGLRSVNGIEYHDIHLVDGTTYLLSQSDFDAYYVKP